MPGTYCGKPLRVTLDDQVDWSEEFHSDGLHLTGNGQRTTIEELDDNWKNPAEIFKREVRAAGDGTDTLTWKTEPGKLRQAVKDKTTTTEKLEDWGEIVTWSYSQPLKEQDVMLAPWSLELDSRLTGKLTTTVDSEGHGRLDVELTRRQERRVPRPDKPGEMQGGFSEHTDNWYGLPSWATSDTDVAVADDQGGLELTHTIGGTFGQLTGRLTKGVHDYNEWVQDGYLNAWGQQERKGEYSSRGTIDSSTLRSGTVTSQYDPEGKLRSAEGEFRHVSKSRGEATARDRESAKGSYLNWRATRQYARDSEDYFDSTQTRVWTPVVVNEEQLDYRRKADAEQYEQTFWGEYSESDTRSVWDGYAWRLPSTTQSRQGLYFDSAQGSGSTGRAPGFYDAGFASWGYEGKSVYARFDSALGPASAQSPGEWNDASRPDMAAGPNLLRQDGGGGSQEPQEPQADLVRRPYGPILPPYLKGQSPPGQRFFLDTPSPYRPRTAGGNMTILVVMADGSIKQMPASIDPKVIERLGGQIVKGHIPGLHGSDFEGAGGLNDLVDSLPLERKTRFYLEPVDPAEAALARELVLIGLDVVGIVDPTPVTDGASGLLSLSQGDLIQAGFSFAGLIPVGEPVKWAGKIQRLARFVDKALDYAKRSPQAAARVAGWLRDIANGMDSVKGILPQSLWDQLAPIRKKIDDFLAPVSGVVDKVAVKGIKAAGVFNHTVKSLDDALATIRKAMPDAVELPRAVAGHPYPSPPPGVKKWFQIHPPEPGVGNNLPHIKFADWTNGKKGTGGSWGHIFFPE
ncbi:MAG: hypothetical protein ACK52A_08010 [Planctomycetota bacterium]